MFLALLTYTPNIPGAVVEAEPLQAKSVPDTFWTPRTLVKQTSQTTVRYPDWNHYAKVYVQAIVFIILILYSKFPSKLTLLFITVRRA